MQRIGISIAISLGVLLAEPTVEQLVPQPTSYVQDTPAVPWLMVRGDRQTRALRRWYRRHRVADFDQDGILDVDDACIQESGSAEYDGCPTPDHDRDGLLDPYDTCPDVPGVFGLGGCPRVDADGDGLFDVDDDCDDVAGEPEYGGCPPIDSDNDGIFDLEDRCDKLPETANQYFDDDGCPDQLPGDLMGALGVVEGIVFEHSSGRLRPGSGPALDALAPVLAAHPSLVVEIRVHTDRRGDDRYNRRLSQRRANSIRNALRRRGVRGPLIASGVGEQEPIASSETAQGRAANRRIELRLADPTG
ncbi:MAG: OmpA family protein [Deltaproteobacteria bacterium]|nr:OmpA family protein [Deltaproteobacteria bacterium]